MKYLTPSDMKPLNLKERKELEQLQKRMAELDMEKAVVFKKLCLNPTYVVTIIEDSIKKVVDKYFDTPKSETVYYVKSGTVEYGAVEVKTPGIRGTKILKEYKVILLITKYDKTGNSYETQYDLRTTEMPKNIENWLKLGNNELPRADAKKFVLAALKKEKEALETRIKIIDKQLK
jgi:hypothetical protein